MRQFFIFSHLILPTFLIVVGFQNCSGFSPTHLSDQEASPTNEENLQLSSSGESTSSASASSSSAQESAVNLKRRVWFSPNLESADYRDLMDFNWNQKHQVQVFKFHSGNLNDSGFGFNNFAQFSARDGFNRLKSFGLEIAIEVGAIKKDTDGNPDHCNGKVWTKAAQDYVQKVESQLVSNQHVDWLHVDEPLYQIKAGCMISFDQAVVITSKYMKEIKSNRPRLKIIDIEPYPALSFEELKSWVDALLSRGVPLEGLTLDVDRSQVNINSAGEKAKFLDFGKYLSSKKLRFGLIYWGTATESNQTYVQDVLNFYVDTSYLRPYIHDVVFQNWHPSINGKLDMPSNLIESENSVASHLGLINSASRYTAQFESSTSNACSLEVHPLEYRAYYPDLRTENALEHYLNFGASEKRCKLIGVMPAGFFRINFGPKSAIFNSNGLGSYCSFKSPAAYFLAGGLPDEANVRNFYGITAGMKYDGDCL